MPTSARVAPASSPSLPPERQALLERLERTSVVPGVVHERPAEAVERRCQLVEVAELAPELDRLVELRDADGRVVQPRHQRAVRRARTRAYGAGRAGSGESGGQAPGPLAHEPAREPEPAERAREAERSVGVALEKPVEGCAHVVMVGLEPPRPLSLGGEAVRIGLLGEHGEVRRVLPPELRRLRRPLEPLVRVLADRVEHQEAVVADPLHEARVDERTELVELGVADLLGRFQWERADEDRQTPEELAAR